MSSNTYYSDALDAALTDVTDEISRLEYEAAVLSGQLEENAQTQDDLRAAIDQNSAAIEENRDQVAAAESAYQSFSNQAEESMGETSDAVNSATISIQDDLVETSEAYAALLEEAKESLGTQIDLLDDMSGKCESSTGDIIKNLQSQREAFDNYADNIQTAMERGIDMGLVQQLSDGSQESMQILAELVTATDDEIAELNAAFGGVSEAKETVAAAMADVKNIVINGLDDAAAEAEAGGYKIGQSTAAGAIAGLNSKAGLYANSVAALAAAGIGSYQKTTDQHSPSRVYKKMAKNDVDGLIVQYEEDTPRLQASAVKLAKAEISEATRIRRASIPSIATAATSPRSADNNQTMQLLQQILKAVQAGQKLVLDTGTFVGGTAEKYDVAMGQRKFLTDRKAI